jgi:hypothetical protein
MSIGGNGIVTIVTGKGTTTQMLTETPNASAMQRILNMETGIATGRGLHARRRSIADPKAPEIGGKGRFLGNAWS